MYSVDCCPKRLVIGKQGENEAEKVVVDFSPWASEFGAGTISARLRRPKDSAAYPVVLTTEGTTATWTVSATDTQYAGAGSLQLVYIVGDMVAKSVIWPVRVLPSLEEGEAPEPYESWLDTLEGLAADTQENARDAAQSAADASASAEDAAQSAQSAAESAASITGLTAVAETLPEGSEASASFDSATDTLTLGIPKGETGATGPAGPAGPKGDTGADGFSPSTSVTKQDGNIVITITDKDGTTSETLEVDDALDDTSENPVQNAAIVEAMRSMLPVDTASGAIASFPDGADDVPMLSLKAQIDPVQDLHGYDSPWPAGGGKNLLPYAIIESPLTKNGITFVRNQDGSIAVNGTSTASFSQTFVEFSLQPGSYYFNCGNSFSMQQNTYAYIRDIDNGITLASITTGNIGTDRAFSIDVQTNVRFYMVFGQTDLVISGTLYPMIRLASVTDATYAPYSNICPISGWTEVNVNHSDADMTNPTTLTINLGQTVYGGKLDVLSGELVVDKAYAEYDGSSDEAWVKHGAGSASAYTMRIPISNFKFTQSVVTVWSNYLPSIDNGKTWGNYDCFISSNVVGACTGIRTITTVDDWRAYLAEHPLQVVYELATPQTYQLTPQEVRTLLGTNNIWNDTGDTEVTYRADIQKFIEKKVTS